MNLRILAIAQKEILQLKRDKRSVAMILLVPILQIIIMGYVVGADVKNIHYAVLDRDHSAMGREIVKKIDESGYFINQSFVDNDIQLSKMLDAGTVKIGLVIPVDFSRNVSRGAEPTLQVLVDGSDSNTATIAQNYFLGIINNYANQLSLERFFKLHIQVVQPVIFKSRFYYNPELKMVNFMIPGVMIHILIFIITMMIALSLVKEKEMGTMEQLLVTPVKSWELIFGKMLPYPLIGLLLATVTVLLSSLWFSVPITGNILLLFLGVVLFLVNILGMGLLIANISKTQQQAMISTIFFLIPNVLLSGFLFSISNMPVLLQWVTLMIPARYFIKISRGIYLKGIGMAYLYPQMAALFIIGVTIVAYAIGKFHKQVDMKKR
jgi:ABC-2 type transport system permease protein